MDNPEKLKKFNFEKLKKIKFDKEKTVFSLCVFLIVIILFKLFYIIIYHFKAESVFHNKPICETYKTLYASELDKGELADIKPILEQAESVECVKIIDIKKVKKDTPKIKAAVKEDRAYNSLTIHEIDK